jgi:2-iminobutanoate/2-iminopropanoate deaminase
MSKSAVSTDAAPKAIGPYSQAVRAGDFLFMSGQVALDPTTGALVPGGVEAETKQVLANLTAVLAAGGATWNDVVRTTIYLTDLGDFATVNRLYGEVACAASDSSSRAASDSSSRAASDSSSRAVPPARATVQVAALPRGAVVEIDAVAFVRDR